MRVLGVDGAGALGGTTKAQDFVLINREVFGFSKPDEFVELVMALVRGPLSLVGYIVRRYGFFGGLKRLREIGKGMARPFSGFATESFFSAAPIANGPYAVRVRLRPEAAAARRRRGVGVSRLGRRYARASGARADPLRAAAPVLQRREDDADRGRRRRLGRGERALRHGGAADDRRAAPRRRRARAARADVEQATFDPWEALAAHRPLGAIMRARKHAYFASQKTRGAVS